MASGPKLIPVAALLLAACAIEGPGGDSCEGGKCDSADDIAAALEGRSDPIATFLKKLEVEKDGTVELDYEALLRGVGEVQGCGPETFSTFVVSDTLLAEEPFPRFVSAVCADDEGKASEFFVAASFEKLIDDEPTGETDTHDLEMFAWDNEARAYRFYAAKPVEGSDTLVNLEIEPFRCQQCHLTPSDLDPTGMPMTPIMNEINRPWTHWRAEPAFPNMDWVVPDRARSSQTFKDLADRWENTAARLEEIIRFGAQTKVAAARARLRREPANLQTVMGMLRPVFCNEQINYASEDFDSGHVFNTILIDDGIRNMFRRVRATDWPWAWINDQTLTLPAPTEDDPALRQIPIRGFSDVTFENQLVSSRILTPWEVLQVRALDWHKPVFSEFRCGLWRSAQEKFTTKPPEFPKESTNADVMSLVLSEILVVGDRRITSGAEDKIIVLDVADENRVEALEEALGGADLASSTCDSGGFCVLTLDEFGARIDTWLTKIIGEEDPREAIKEIRDERICHVLEEVETDQSRFQDFHADGNEPARFENHPSLPDVKCGFFDF